MITENTTERARALGAIVTGNKPAKSWLGVPMIIAGDVVGAVAIQDTEHEHRFTDSDLRLLTALAAQVAPIVRNARLLAETQAAAERDRHLYEITDQIRRATSLEAILEITTRELSDALNLKRARIDIRVNPSEVKTSPHKSEGGTE
jgi:GAF domain-containing protein